MMVLRVIVKGISKRNLRELAIKYKFVLYIQDTQIFGALPILCITGFKGREN